MTSGIYSRQLSSQGPPLVLIHGLFGSLENLAGIARYLMDNFSVYAIDLPNHGRSSHTEVITLHSMAESVQEWMEESSLTQAHFLGHSLGGKVSMEIALQQPKRVERLIVADISPVSYPRRHDDVFQAFDAVDLQAIKTRLMADEMMRPFVNELSTRSFLLKNLEKGEQGWFWRHNLKGLIAAYDDLVSANCDICEPFPREVLFIKGELSPYIQPEHEQPILNRFPKARVKIINGTQHWLHAEKPAVFSGIANRFLSE